MVQKRLFIGGLYKGATEEALRKRFSSYGNILSIDIKVKPAVEGVKTFAYLDIDASDNDFEKCFRAYNNSKWKGSKLNVQFAKDSFMKRLEEERKSQQITQDNLPVSGNKDRNVEKYGRDDNKQALPSKYSTNVKRTTYEDTQEADHVSTNDLTWDLNGSDNEATKKRKGEFWSGHANKRKFQLSNNLPGTDDNMKIVPISKSGSKGVTSDDGYDTGDIGETIGVSKKLRREFDSNPKSASQTKTRLQVNSLQERLLSLAQTKATRCKTRKNRIRQNDKVLKKFDKGKNEPDSALNENSPLIDFRGTRPSHDHTIAFENTGDKNTEHLNKKRQNDKMLKRFNKDISKQDSALDSKDVPLTEFKGTKFLDGDIPAIENEGDGIGAVRTDPDSRYQSDSDSIDSDFETLKRKQTSANQHSFLNVSKNIVSPKSSKIQGNQQSVVDFKDDDDDDQDSVGSADTDEIILSSKSSNRTKTSKIISKMKPSVLSSKLALDEYSGGLTSGHRTYNSNDKQESKKSSAYESSDEESNFENLEERKPATQKVNDKQQLNKKKSDNDNSSYDESDFEALVDEHATQKASNKQQIKKKSDSSESSYNDSDFEALVDELEPQKVNKKQHRGRETGSFENSDDESDFEALVKRELAGQKIKVKQQQSKSSSYKNSDDESDSETHAERDLATQKVINKQQQGKMKDNSDSLKQLKVLSQSPKACQSYDKRSLKNLDTKSGDFVTDSKERNRHMRGGDDMVETPISKHDVNEQPPDKDVNLDTDKKRQEVVKQRQKEYQAQKSLIQKALANLDEGSTTNKKIVFEDSDESSGDEEVSGTVVSEKPSEAEVGESHSKSVKKFAKTGLFEESSEESGGEEKDQDMFKVRPEFQGPGGKKLMSLQSRYGNDERFKLDTRFIESDSEAEENVVQEEDERIKQLRILASVAGTSTGIIDKVVKAKKTFKDVSQLHFDPTKEEHSQLEIKSSKESEQEKAKKKKNKKLKDGSEAAREHTNEERSTRPRLPEVSQEKFYEVSDSVKEVFSRKDKPESESKGFSLLAAFGRKDLDSGDETDAETEEKTFTAVLDKLTLGSRFKVAESDSEHEEHGDETVDKDEDPSEKPKSIFDDLASVIQPTAFFFTVDDPRLKEGENFYSTEDMEVVRERWLKIRPELQESFRQKHKKFKRNLKIIKSSKGGKGRKFFVKSHKSKTK